MAVSTTNALSGPYVTNGVTVTFPFSFTAPTEDEVDVVLVAADGVETTAAGYVVTLAQDAGGAVTFTTPPASGYSLYVLLDPSFRQEITFENGSAWRAEPVNEGYDRSAARDQVLRREVNRSFKVPFNGTAVAGQFPSVGPDGEPVFVSGTGADGALRADLAQPGLNKGAALIGHDQTKAPRDNTIPQYFAKIRNLAVGPFNAKGDGSDETDRIAEWLAEAQLGYELEGPSGSFGTTVPMVLPAIPNLSIRMAGSGRSRFLYLGDDPEADIFTAGDNALPTHMDIHGFAVDTAMSMTSGSRAIVLKSPYQGYRLIDLRPGSLDANISAKIWHGIRIEQGRQGGLLQPGTYRANGDCIQVLGDGSSPTGADLTISGGAVLLGGESAVHVGGGFGGIYIEELLGYGNNFGLKCTRELVDRANREIIMEATCVWDAQFTAHEYFDMPDGADASTNDRLFVLDSSYCSGAGFIGGAPATGVWIKSAPYAQFVFNGKFVKSPTQDAYLIEDATAKIQGDDGCYIGYTGRDGIRSTVPTDNVQWKSELFDQIGGLRMSSNIRFGRFATMPVNAATGSIGNAGATMRYSRAGNTFQTNDVQIDIVDNGTAGGSLGITMPFTVKNMVSFSGVTNGGIVVGGRMLANTNILVITTAAGTYPGGTGVVISLRGGGEIYG